MKTILYLTDLYYEAKGRAYYSEDLYLTRRLKEHFNILIGHPQQAMAFFEVADLVVFRNTGPVIAYQEYFNAFMNAVKEKKVQTFNSFDGKADRLGKQYLLELTNEGYPVIPTIETSNELDKLGNASQYITKLKYGADSIGMKRISKTELEQSTFESRLIQPYIDFKYEVSFYYINNDFQYALYAPDKEKRWALQEYEPTATDLAFAGSFIEWNAMNHGITRVDACRLKNNSLLLVELEDLNPYLSLDLLSGEKREAFVQNWIKTLEDLLFKI